jgi:phosphoribosylanthranilate isomerase
VAKLPDQVEKIGVFLYQDSEEAPRIADAAGLTGLQIHMHRNLSPQSGNNGELFSVFTPRPRKLYLALPASWFLADGPFRANLASFIESRPGRPIDTILLDSETPDRPGGTGTAFDWERAAPVFEKMGANINLVAAGGLTPTNVIEAIRILKPWGVDVSSGVEAHPGKKDPAKVCAFITAVRSTEGNH